MLKEEIQQDLNSAVKGKKELETSVLRQIVSAVLNKEKEKRYKISKEKPELSGEALEEKSNITQEELLEALSSEAKKRREAEIEFKRGGRPDLAEKEKKELEILKKYLPAQLSEGQIRDLVIKVIEKTGAKGIKDMGRVMAELAPQIKGTADGGAVYGIVKEILFSKN